jgi:hypothetical protein
VLRVDGAAQYEGETCKSACVCVCEVKRFAVMVGLLTITDRWTFGARAPALLPQTSTPIQDRLGWLHDVSPCGRNIKIT